MAEVVPVYVTVTDATGRLVTDLTEQDFRVLEDGLPRDIALFSSDAQPMVATMMLDMSEENVADVVRVRAAAGRFVDAVRPADRVSIGSFGREIAISPFATDERAELARVLAEELWPGGPAPLWRGLRAALDSLPDIPERRVVLILTRGRSTDPPSTAAATIEDVSRMAATSPVMVYAVGMEGSGVDRRLAALAARTGGGHFDVRRNADLGATFARVADELRHQYVLGILPSSTDAGDHTLAVTVNRPRVTVRARDGYRQGGR